MGMARGLICVGALFIAANATAQTIVRVDDDADPGGDGSAWETAFRFLQDALAFASDPGNGVDEIRVAKGTYRPDMSEATPKGSGDPEATFMLVPEVAHRGGYLGLLAKKGEDPDHRDPVQYPTVLSGAIAENLGSCHVLTCDAPSALLVEGLTVISGEGCDGDGGGLVVVRGAPVVVECGFELNLVLSGNGGAVAVMAGEAEFTSCSFHSNLAGLNGGAMVVWDASVTLEACTFFDNLGAIAGGAVASLGADACLEILDCSFVLSESLMECGGAVRASGTLTVERCEFRGNLSFDCSHAGGVSVSAADVNIRNSLFECNTGGLHATDGSFVEVESTVFRSNSGGGLHAEGSEVLLTACLFESNTSRGAVLSRSMTTAAACQFIANRTTGSGGGLVVVGVPGEVCLVDCTFEKNESFVGGDAIAVLAGTSLMTANTTLNGNFGSGSAVYNWGTATGAGFEGGDAIANEGTIVVGDEYALDGTLIQIASGTTTIGISPKGAGQLIVGGEFQGGGRLTLGLVDFDPLPSPGESFVIGSYGSFGGPFTVVESPVFDGLFLKVGYVNGNAAGEKGTIVATVTPLSELIELDGPQGPKDDLAGLPRAVAVGEFDGADGEDVAVVTSGPDRLFIVRNAGLDTGGAWLGWAEVVEIAEGIGPIPGGLAAADLDGAANGLDDLLVSYEGDGTIAILLNESSPDGVSFADAIVETIGGKPRAVATADFDGDGVVDIAAGTGDPKRPEQGAIFVFRGPLFTFPLPPRPGGDLPFALRPRPLNRPPGPPGLLGEAPVTIDLVGLTTITNDERQVVPHVVVFLNTGDEDLLELEGMFIPIGPAGSEFASLDVGDLTRDGFADLVATSVTAQALAILLNTAGSGFEPPVLHDAGGVPGAVVTADLDLDADSDIAAVVDLGETSVLRIFNNISTTIDGPEGPEPQLQFIQSDPEQQPQNPLLVAAGDVNGDGLPDLVAVADPTAAIAGGPGLLFKPEGLLNLFCPDFDGDGDVDEIDLLVVVEHWGEQDPSGDGPGDVNSDGVVDVEDLIQIILSWGSCPASAIRSG